MTGTPPTSRATFGWVAPAAIVVAVLALAVVMWQGHTALLDLQTTAAANQKVLDEVLGEVTRLRIEQSAGQKGPQALLDKLKVYAPLLNNSRVTEPDYQSARKEMEAILRAFATLGSDAWKPVQDRLEKCKPEVDYDEIKCLLEAGARIDRDAGKKQLQEVLLGRKFPSPRLRWFAAELLTRLDQSLAQTLLRQILLTESSRGVDPARAAQFGGGIPDQRALSATGFNNFVQWYVRSDDPRMDDVLQQVIGRSEHDAITVQDCIKVLGTRKVAAAVPQIEKLFLNPPYQQENPIFLNYCLEALFDIQGKASKPFLEQALANSRNEAITRRIQDLLHRIATGQTEPPPSPVKAADKK
jgi:hypothetical protein